MSCVADDVRSGKPGKMPKDKLINSASASNSSSGDDDFMTIPDGAEEEVPF